MKKKHVFQTLIKNYISFTSILIGIVILTLILSVVILNTLMSNEEMPMISADQLVRGDYEHIDISDLNIAEGWIEILDDQGDVIFVKGNKTTDEMTYSVNDLVDLIGFQDNMSHFYQSKSFISDQNEELILLVVLPHGEIDYEMTIEVGTFDVSKKLTTTLMLSFLILISLFIVNILFYSRWMSKKIKMPLESITKGIEKMSEGHFDQEMTFEAESEFLQIRDAFNEMIIKLRQAELDKRHIEESKNQMFVHISHDLKTPITTITGFSKALIEGMIKDEDKFKKYLETIYQKSNRMTKLIDDIFELSKLESIDYHIEKQKSDIVEVIRAHLAEHYEQIEQKKMQMKFVNHVESLYMYINQKEIGRVISNLVGNAIYYNPEGTTIEIEVSGNQEIVVIDVKDDGVGIDDEIKDDIFMPFIKGDHARSSKEGSGLGLAIAKKIIEQHQGEIILITDDQRYKTIFRMTLKRL